ncbi:hypothetical protein N7486_003277 [Penicillium sp. IBT 16267x]|nr:hypothetical protein N7486_003277 [Penicillium sp. IBT 16267x]
MEKKGKSQRNARDIQTPASDRASNSPKPDTPTAATGPAIIGAAQKQDPKKKSARFARSPTRKDDFAPGELDDEYESNDMTDSDFGNESEQDVPMEHRPDPISRWAKEVIKAETAKESTKIAEIFLTSSNPDYDACRQFFERLNQMIRAANEEHNVRNIDNGIIPVQGYYGLCKTWREQMTAASAKESADDACESWAEQEIGSPNPVMRDVSDVASRSSVEDQQADALSEPQNDFESEDETTGLDDLEDLDALEARTMNEQRRLTSGKVLYWWPKGTGSQTFIRYGDRHTPIYRIRAGSHQSYNRHQVECVLTTKTRGNAKLIRRRNGLKEEYWKYQRKHVKNILGVGWKVYGDDENDLDPLALLRPEKGVVYPETRTLVKWKDNALTLEGRAFMRRITYGSFLDGDRVLYQKACEMENSYRKIHGLDESESDIDGFIEKERPKRKARRRRDQEWSEDNSDSDNSVQSSYNRGTKQSDLGRQNSARPNQRDENIRSLQRQLRQLKMETPDSTQPAYAKPRRRGRTA